MTSPQDPALDALADGLAEELDGVSTSVDGEVTSYARGEVVFARASSRVTRYPPAGGYRRSRPAHS